MYKRQVTIRVLMDESLTGKQKFELVLKEMKIAFSNGFILGVLSFVLIGLYIALFKGKSFLFAYAVSGCIGASLLLAMVISGAVGTCIPLFFKKIHVDPAVASGPLITTVNDLSLIHILSRHLQVISPALWSGLLLVLSSSP